MLQSDIDLMKRINESQNHIFELPVDKWSELDETLRYLTDAGYVKAHPKHPAYPGKRIYTLTRNGLEAIEEAEKLASKEAEEKRKHAVNNKVAILCVVLSFLLGLVSGHLPQIIAFFRSLLHR